VERIPAPGDRRSSLVGLTERGKEVAGQAMAAHMTCEAAITSSLPEADRPVFAELLKKLLAGMEE
jgi:DNA-binding MarR family transcriptional regulator